MTRLKTMQQFQKPSTSTALSVASLIVMLVGNAGCVHWKHYLREHCVSSNIVDSRQGTYHHSPQSGRIVPKEGFACPCKETPAFHGYEPTCWRQFPTGWGCPPEHHVSELANDGMVESPAIELVEPAEAEEPDAEESSEAKEEKPERIPPAPEHEEENIKSSGDVEIEARRPAFGGPSSLTVEAAPAPVKPLDNTQRPASKAAPPKPTNTANKSPQPKPETTAPKPRVSPRELADTVRVKAAPMLESFPGDTAKKDTPQSKSLETLLRSLPEKAATPLTKHGTRPTPPSSNTEQRVITPQPMLRSISKRSLTGQQGKVASPAVAKLDPATGAVVPGTKPGQGKAASKSIRSERKPTPPKVNRATAQQSRVAVAKSPTAGSAERVPLPVKKQLTTSGPRSTARSGSAVPVVRTAIPATFSKAPVVSKRPLAPSPVSKIPVPSSAATSKNRTPPAATATPATVAKAAATKQNAPTRKSPGVRHQTAHRTPAAKVIPSDEQGPLPMRKVKLHIDAETNDKVYSFSDESPRRRLHPAAPRKVVKEPTVLRIPTPPADLETPVYSLTDRHPRPVRRMPLSNVNEPSKATPKAMAPVREQHPTPVRRIQLTRFQH